MRFFFKRILIDQLDAWSDQIVLMAISLFISLHQVKTKNTFFLIIALYLLSCSKEETETWKPWQVNEQPVFEGQYPLVGDPSVIKENGKYRMYYTGFDAYRAPQGPEICQATSPDGITWTNVKVNDLIEGRMLYTESNTWSDAHETCFALKFNNSYLLYFIGYQDKGGFFNSNPIGLGLVTSSNAEDFSATQGNPIMESTLNGFDRDAFSSPSITTYQDSLIMIYAGYCYADCGTTVSRLLAATSSDGVEWVKKSNPIISGTEIPWASKGVAESELILGPDRLYYLFMTSINEPHVIGVARSISPFGPWDVNPQPIVKADKSFSTSGALAPSVLIEDYRVRLWYHGFTENEIQIGYAESSWPMKN